MVRLTVALKAPAQREQDLVSALRFLRVGTLLEAGCLRCFAWVDSDGAVQYVEEWATDEDLRRHVRSERFTSLLAVVESATEQPHVQFDFISATRGLDYAAEIRRDLVK